MGIKFKRKISIAAILFIILLICCFLPKIVQRTNRFGYFVSGPRLFYNHYISQNNGLVRLDDGNILILGTNNEHSKKNELSIEYIPFELYDVVQNKIKIIDFKIDKNLLYRPEGILLKNNKLLLTAVGDKNNPIYPTSSFKRNEKIKYIETGIIDGSKESKLVPFNNMAIVDLNTKEVEKIIPKKLEQKFRKNIEPGIKLQLVNESKAISLLGNFVEVFDLEKGTSKIIPFDYNYKIDTLIKTNSGILLIGINAATLEPIIIRYNDNTETFEYWGTRESYKTPVVQEILDNSILIVGTSTLNNSRYSYGEIYNLKNKEVVGTIKLLRDDYRGEANPSFGMFALNKRYVMIFGGVAGMGYPIGPKSIKTSEILDMKKQIALKGPNVPFSSAVTIKLNNGDIFFVACDKTAIFKVNKLLKGDE